MDCNSSYCTAHGILILRNGPDTRPSTNRCLGSLGSTDRLCIKSPYEASRSSADYPEPDAAVYQEPEYRDGEEGSLGSKGDSLVHREKYAWTSRVEIPAKPTGARSQTVPTSVRTSNALNVMNKAEGIGLM
jgi:hypothetical protein